MRQAMSWAATPRPHHRPGRRQIPSMIVVMTFNGGDIDANDQCTGDSRGGEPQPEGAVQVMASFCGSGTPLSSTSGRIKNSTGAADPQFAALISRVTRDLLSRRLATVSRDRNSHRRRFRRLRPGQWAWHRYRLVVRRSEPTQARWAVRGPVSFYTDQQVMVVSKAARETS